MPFLPKSIPPSPLHLDLRDVVGEGGGKGGMFRICIHVVDSYQCIPAKPIQTCKAK